MGKNKKSKPKKSLMNRVIDGVFNGLGLVVALSPAIQGVKEDLSNPADIPNKVAYLYTGYRTSDGYYNIERTKSGLGSVAVGGVIAGIPRIFRFVRKLVRGR